jgi:hypothetical protein
LSSIVANGCTGPESSIQCDANGINCFICDGTSCRPANPTVTASSSSSSGGGGAGGEAPCDPNVTTCGCASNTDCPSDLSCIDGLCIVGCNNSFECGAGKVCVNGKCEIGCNDQKPCESGYLCQKGYCAPDGANPQCAAEKQCAAGTICVDGICQLECDENTDCVAGEVCDATSGSCILDPSPTPSCGPDKPCLGAAQCGADGYCHYGCMNLTECKLVDSRFFACDLGICKTEEEVNPECTLKKPCPAGKDCVSNQCL